MHEFQILATVHDEAVLLVPDDVKSVERIGAIAQQEMIAAFLEVFPDVPTLNLVDPKVGPTWGICRHCRTGCKVTILTRGCRRISLVIFYWNTAMVGERRPC